jgi:hypothetical protein
MKSVPLLLFAAATSLCAAELPPAWLFESSLQSRVGFDSNPVATSGTSAAILGSEETLTYAAAVNLSLALSAVTPAKPSLKLTYAGEAVRFDRWSGENFATNRFGASGQFTVGVWKFTGEGSSLYVDGSKETLLAVPSVNANAISLWRERRRQWQHRLKLQSQAEFGAVVVRGTGTLLAYDYQTQVVAGRFAFADRSDIQGALDLGWRQSPDSLWLAGVRAGQQEQAIIPLPNCAFDYSNTYHRLVAGWEGKPVANTTVTLAAGPDFRHYSGAIDSRVFLGGRDRTSFWCEGGFVAKPIPTLTLTGKVARMDWLSSTGKSAYVDSNAETAAVWTLSPAWTARLLAKVHRCEYFPLVRDDWESFLGAGATLKLSARTQLTMDFLRHNAWNNLAGVPEREFQRLVLILGATLKL